MSTGSAGEPPKTATYLVLFAVQMLGAGFVVWDALPAFQQLVLNPGQQVVSTRYDGLSIIAVMCAMQFAYWYRYLRVVIPFWGPNRFLSHVFLFIGRLSFIFGSALFSTVLFRHLPELGSDVDIILFGRRAIVFIVSLFALFCFSLELERLGAALGERPARTAN
jgi:hypothetical protein